MTKLEVIQVVYAKWCPHCIPTTVEPLNEAARKLGVGFEALDIDTPEVEKADELVEKYGDWSPDYLIPQVFLKFHDGRVEHVLTGDPKGVEYTRRAVEELLRTKLHN